MPVEPPIDLPKHLFEAYELLARGGVTPIAGGTDLMVRITGEIGEPPERMLDLSRVDALKGIAIEGGALVLGARTTYTEIRRSALVQAHLPALVEAAATIGAIQIQNRGTIGGNIANASPAGDSLPALMALDAVVHARSLRGERTIPFGALYRGYRDLALSPDELITAVTIPFAPPRSVQFFRKVGTRRAQSISKVVMAAVLRLARDGRVDHVRLAWGSVAPVTLLAGRAEEALLGERPSRAAAVRARAALMRDIAPIDDIRSDREYRLAVAGNLLEHCLRAADPRFARG